MTWRRGARANSAVPRGKGDKVVTAPQLSSVDSSSIAAIGYDAMQRALWVQFVTGRTYRYHDVGQATYEEFMAAESKGRYFNREIRDTYPFTRV